jgi:hypothetical protein
VSPILEIASVSSANFLTWSDFKFRVLDSSVCKQQDKDKDNKILTTYQGTLSEVFTAIDFNETSSG